MDSFLTDNQVLETHEDKVILNFCFSKTLSGNPVVPIRRVPHPFRVHLVGVGWLSEFKQLTQQILIMTFKQKEIMANYEKNCLPFNTTIQCNFKVKEKEYQK